VIEDAAQGLLATYHGQPLGAIGDMGAVSFHETKNVVAGEGGALLLRDDAHIARAEIIREKGTNRSAFFRGEIDKYTWVDVGSSYLPSEIVAAFLWAQLQHAERLTARRLGIWQRYHEAFAELEDEGLVRRPIIPPGCRHNAHMYYLLVANVDTRQRILDDLRAMGIGAIFHYVPLHSAPAGLKHGRAVGDMTNTEELSERLIRLPLWPGVESQLDRVIEQVQRSIFKRAGALAAAK
jgi:dTDP-4-amino-4,6-dideoxygalactose transaminase